MDGACTVKRPRLNSCVPASAPTPRRRRDGARTAGRPRRARRASDPRSRASPRPAEARGSTPTTVCPLPTPPRSAWNKATHFRNKATRFRNKATHFSHEPPRHRLPAKDLATRKPVVGLGLEESGADRLRADPAARPVAAQHDMLATSARPVAARGRRGAAARRQRCSTHPRVGHDVAPARCAYREHRVSCTCSSSVA
jgi:hypothetical protein